jgi:Condensation domain
LEHMITDMTSNMILQRELWTLYQQGAQGLPLSLSLPDLPMQFGDYAAWEQRAAGAWTRQHGEYWKGHLAGAPQTRLPANARSVRTDCAPTLLTIPLGIDVSNRLRALACGERTLLSLAVLAIYAATMSRWCMHHYLVIKFQSHARFRPELQSMVGYLANCLHLRIAVSAEDSFTSLLKQIKAELCSAYEHQDAGRVPDVIPECRTDLCFNWIPDRAAGQYEVNPMLRVERFLLHVPVTALQPHFATFGNTPEGIIASAYYCANLFAPGAVERFDSTLRTFAEEFALRPRDPMRSIPVQP